VRSGNHFPRRHYVPYFYSNRSSHARFNWSDGLKDSGYDSRRFFRVDGQRYGASSADTLEERHGTGSPDALEERHSTSSADSLERHGTSSTNTLVRFSVIAE
jgi:hypothetical protein